MFDVKQPLWMPRGSVRAIIALLDTAGALAMIANGIAVPEWYTTQLATVIAFYFAGKNGSTNGS